MKKRRYRWLGMLLIPALLLCGCGQSQSDSAKTGEQEEAVQEPIEVSPTADINDLHLRDKDALYAQDEDTSVVTMYLTVSQGNEAENTDHTWEEINTYSVYDYEAMGVERYQTAALLQVGDEDGPLTGEVGYGESVPNATVQIRGQTSTRNPQKSYKIELKKNKGTWRGQRTINLNKHMTDGVRFRNKLAFDLLEEIPQLMALRTQFVHLYVKDNTGNKAGGFEDYGLYTQVEQLNKTGMKAHGLDSQGQLYKITNFDFHRYEDVIKDENDPEYDSEAFEAMLEIKGSNDHSKLIEMLDAVNDKATPIDDVLDTYFDRENIAYWLAFQILVGNADTECRNVFLYSPLNSQTWYFIPWDQDASFMRTEYAMMDFSDLGSWQSGISNYWGNVLFQRALKSKTFLQELDAAILDLKEHYLTKEHIKELADQYVKVVKPYAFSMPDSLYIGHTKAEYDTIVAAIPGEVEQNYQLYLESLRKPMPFYIGLPEVVNGKLKINWDPSFDYGGEDITYSIEVASDYLYKNVIYKKDGLKLTECTMKKLPAGQYFIRVRATNSSGLTQDAFDYYVIDSGKVYGTKCFYVLKDGKIREDEYEE